jgi:hypothetical protein
VGRAPFNCLLSAFPPIINDFGGASSDRGNTGPFWVGSGLAILSALITLVLIRPLSHDGMVDEDEKFREYLVQNGYDVSLLGLSSEASSFQSDGLEKSESYDDPKA